MCLSIKSTSKLDIYLHVLCVQTVCLALTRLRSYLRWRYQPGQLSDLRCDYQNQRLFFFLSGYR